jgi:hypothetical protein
LYFLFDNTAHVVYSLTYGMNFVGENYVSNGNNAKVRRSIMMKMKSLILVIAVAFTFVMGVNTQAQSVRWVGSDGNWTNYVGNWDDNTGTPLGRVPDGTDNLVGINNDAIITIDELTSAVLLKAENAALDTGTLIVRGDLTVNGTFEVGRHSEASLIIDGGAVTHTAGAIYNGHYSDATSYTEVKNGGSLSAVYFRSDGADSTIIITNDASSITTSGNNTFANSDVCKNNFKMYDGTMTTTGRDFWGGTRMDLLIAGGVYTNSGDQFYWQSRANGTGTVSITGGELYTTASFYVASGLTSVVDVVQSGGLVKMTGASKDFSLGAGVESKATYTISGGTNIFSRHLQVPQNGVDASFIQTGGKLVVPTGGNLYLGNYPAKNTNAVYRISGGELECYRLVANQSVPALFEVVGTDPIVTFTDYLDIRHASTTIKFTVGETGVSAINSAGAVYMGDSGGGSPTLEVDLSDFNFGTTTLTLIDCSNLSGEFGTVNLIGCALSATVVYDTANDEVRLENIKSSSKGTVLIVQ